MPLEFTPEIASTIPPEHLSHEAIQRYNSMPEFVKGHIEQREFISRAIALPKADSKPEDVQKWRQETGEKLKGHGFTVAPLTDLPPQSPDAYDFKIEGVTPEQIQGDKALTSFRSFAHKTGLNNATANALVEWYQKEAVPMLHEALKGQEVEIIEDDAQVEKILGERFKDETPLRREEFNRGVQALSQTIPDLKDFLEGTAPNGKAWIANKNHPALVQLISEVARLQAQDFGGNVDGKTVTADGAAAKAEADDIIGNKANPKYEQYWKGDKTTVAHVEELYKKAHPGEVTL
jgi:hypothetical protein